MSFRIGQLFSNVLPESDSDENGADRITPAGSTWRVTEVGDEYVSIVCDATGGWINPTHDEMLNTTMFTPAPAASATT